ncbi:hypothetical protein EDD11_009864 [Mortierella claussenii]|nr:hypothetical protein EDD11_009864 [Mortierella claussenii]
MGSPQQSHPQRPQPQQQHTFHPQQRQQRQYQQQQNPLQYPPQSPLVDTAATRAPMRPLHRLPYMEQTPQIQPYSQQQQYPQTYPLMPQQQQQQQQQQQWYYPHGLPIYAETSATSTQSYPQQCQPRPQSLAASTSRGIPLSRDQRPTASNNLLELQHIRQAPHSNQQMPTWPIVSGVSSSAEVSRFGVRPESLDPRFSGQPVLQQQQQQQSLHFQTLPSRSAPDAPQVVGDIDLIEHQQLYLRQQQQQDERRSLTPQSSGLRQRLGQIHQLQAHLQPSLSDTAAAPHYHIPVSRAQLEQAQAAGGRVAQASSSASASASSAAYFRPSWPSSRQRDMSLTSSHRCADPYPLRSRGQRGAITAAGPSRPSLQPPSTHQTTESQRVTTTIPPTETYASAPASGAPLPLPPLYHNQLSQAGGRVPPPPISSEAFGLDVELCLPPQAPISMQCPQADHSGDHDVYMEDLVEEEEEPVEVTLNMDIPKTSSPAAAGDPNITVLSVNPSWHCVFVETVQHQQIRTSIRIQFCPSPVSPTYNDHQAKVQSLKTVQVIAYSSRQVEMTRRVCGQHLLRKGGIMNPMVISYNDASYGFTLSLSSFQSERLSRSNAFRPDEPLPLTRQQNSAYCRRNLKELYCDTLSKDVAIILRPSGHVFYAHSVVLENYGYFRTLLERVGRETTTNINTGNRTTMGVGVGSQVDDEAISSSSTHASVDEEGYARPLQPTEPSQQQPPQRSQHSLPQQPGLGGRQEDRTSNRIKSRIEFQDVNAYVLRAVLHYMYMGHIPVATTTLPRGLSQRPVDTSTCQTGDGTGTTTGAEGTASLSEVNASHQAATQGEESSGSSTTGSFTTAPVLAGAARAQSMPSRSPPPATAIVSTEALSLPSLGRPTDPVTSGGPTPLNSTSASVSTTEFSWRELYETASRFQLSGMTHLSRLVLISRLDPDLAIQELFEWAYQYWSLVPSYVSYLIEHIDPDLLQWEDDADKQGQDPTGTASSGPRNTTARRSVLWPYHDQCPRFDDIMVVFLQMLNERKETSTLV